MSRRGPEPRQALLILDALYIDAGWLTSHGIAEATNLPHESVRRVLYKLRRSGDIESRTVEMAGAGHNGSPIRRNEWRVAWHG